MRVFLWVNQNDVIGIEQGRILFKDHLQFYLVRVGQISAPIAQGVGELFICDLKDSPHSLSHSKVVFTCR